MNYDPIESFKNKHPEMFCIIDFEGLKAIGKFIYNMAIIGFTLLITGYSIFYYIMKMS